MRNSLVSIHWPLVNIEPKLTGCWSCSRGLRSITIGRLETSLIPQGWLSQFSLAQATVQYLPMAVLSHWANRHDPVQCSFLSFTPWPPSTAPFILFIKEFVMRISLKQLLSVWLYVNLSDRRKDFFFVVCSFTQLCKVARKKKHAFIFDSLVLCIHPGNSLLLYSNFLSLYSNFLWNFWNKIK